MSQQEVYLGNPNLKKANTPIEFSEENILEFLEKVSTYAIFAANAGVKGASAGFTD